MKNRRYLIWIMAGAILIVAGILLTHSLLPVTIHARIAEDGGFTPDHITAKVGKPLHLRLISEDVQHTFAVGQYPMDPVVLEPHQPVAVTLTFENPGSYTFYTTTPSSLNFWRMRGTIEVVGGTPEATAEPPLYVRLGLNLDEEHESEEENIQFPSQPSAIRGSEFAGQIASKFLTPEYYFSNSPMETFESLKVDYGMDDAATWDIVAYIWAQNTSAAALTEGEYFYEENCSACHGVTGRGDGQFADEMKALATGNEGEMGIEAPTDFSQPGHLLESPPAVVQGLILRGGMGTGMPMWGSIFTDEQTWDLVAYLYSFHFNYAKEVR